MRQDACPVSGSWGTGKTNPESRLLILGAIYCDREAERRLGRDPSVTPMALVSRRQPASMAGGS